MMRSISAEWEVGPDPIIPEAEPELLEEIGAGDDVTVMADEYRCPVGGASAAEAVRVAAA